jgi:hypothetical protein
MPVQRSRFHAATQSPPEQKLRTEIIEPVGGLNWEHLPSNLKPGETPYSVNFVAKDNALEARSGLSSWGTTGITGTVLGYAVGLHTNDREEHNYILSSATVQQFYHVTGRWVPQSSVVPISSDTGAYYHTAIGIRNNSSLTSGPTTVFATNWARSPLVWAVGPPTNPISHLTEVYSIFSYARYIAAADDRMLFFHSGTTTVSSVTDTSAVNPTRATWSARGNHFAYGTGGGGFEDINMLGIGTGIVSERDRVILFSDQQTWGGRPRRDAYAFDFFAIDNGVGLPPEYDRTPQNTDAGTIFLGAGFQFYRVAGAQVRALGNKVRKFLHHHMREWSHCFSTYDPTNHIYAFHYSDTTGEYPTRALYLRTDTIAPISPVEDDGVWFDQDFDNSSAVTLQYSAGGNSKNKLVMVTSAGSGYRLDSDLTADNGRQMVCTWRSHSMRAAKDLLAYEMLQELWLETESNAPAGQPVAVNVSVSTNDGAYFQDSSTYGSVTSGINYTHIPISAHAAGGRNTTIQLDFANSCVNRISRIGLTLRSYTGRHSGAR